MSDRRTETETGLSSQAVTAATQSSSMYVGDYTEALVFVAVTVKSGTNPTLDPVVQVSHDDSTWFNHPSGTFSQITTVSNNIKAVTNIGKYIRVNIPLPGGTDTPTFTLSVVIQAKN